jgi:GDP-L-fucose synthase
VFTIESDAPFFVAGHNGMVGASFVRLLMKSGHTNILTVSKTELDLRNRAAVFDFFSGTMPKYVLLAAARVGGILANKTRPVEFLSDNLQIQVNVMDAALKFNTLRLVFLGSSCVYPRMSPQPIKETQLLQGSFEPTNEAYAVAKVAGIKQVQAVRRQYGLPWISVMPTNLYGPGDNYREGESHVLAALVKRFVDAERLKLPFVTNWGSGEPLREFMHVDDLSSALYQLLHNYDEDLPVNVGSGEEYSIKQISEMVSLAVRFNGEVRWDQSMPDGVMRKRLASANFHPRHTLDGTIKAMVAEYSSSLR